MSVLRSTSPMSGSVCFILPDLPRRDRRLVTVWDCSQYLELAVNPFITYHYGFAFFLE